MVKLSLALQRIEWRGVSQLLAALLSTWRDSPTPLQLSYLECSSRNAGEHGKGHTAYIDFNKASTFVSFKAS